jgi:undecaprenyl diphosphate synthase
MATGVGRARAAEYARMGIAPGWNRCAWSSRSACGTYRGLTLFAFSSENWGRPRDEVMSLMSLFVESLEAEIEELHRTRRAGALHRRARPSSMSGCA